MTVYREQAEGLPELQMREAVGLLIEWERFNPVIAGGSLWAWAAGSPARDVDIFLRSTRRSRRTVSNWTKQADGHVLVKTIKKIGERYKSAAPATVGIVIDRRVGLFVESDTPVDILLTPWAGLRAPEHFDYRHCAVAWSSNCFQNNGAAFYVAGKIVRTYPKSGYARDIELVKGKVQENLWGNKDASKRLQQVFSKLQDTYKDILRQR